MNSMASRVLLLIGSLLSTGFAEATEQVFPAWAVKVEGRALASAKGWLATWPGVNWQAGFHGTAIGVRLDDSRNWYLLQIDGQTVRDIAPAPGERTIWLRDLPPGRHAVKLIKRTESTDYAGRFAGFVLDGGHALPAPAVKQRKIEFLGDSWTASYGNLSASRTCSEAGIIMTTDASQSFAAMVGRKLDADIRITAHSGLGMVRNWAGGLPEVDFRSFYPRVLQDRPLSVAGNKALQDGNWQPRVVVIGLGINDFSTAVGPQEGRTQEQLARDYLQAYRQFLQDIRLHYGNVAFVLAGTYLWPDDRLRPLVSQLVNEERARGYSIAYVDWQGITLNGCNWHPDVADHRKMAEQIEAGIRQLGSIWF